ncbi:MAG: hypothetical protein HFF50_04825 [Lawsonibacter sp.]|nr:hypothetical protein [Lawsonibacter sp.]
MAKRDDSIQLELLQAWSEPPKSWSLIDPVVLEQREWLPVYLSQSQETLFRPDASGRLQPWQFCGPLPPKLPKPPDFPFFRSGGRVGYLEKADLDGYSPSQVTCTVWDSAGGAPCTLSWKSERRVCYARLYLLDGGDFLSYARRLTPRGFEENWGELARRAPDGTKKWSLDVYGTVSLIRKHGIWLLTESKDDWQDYVWVDLKNGQENMRQRRRGHRKAFHFGVDSDDLWVVESDGKGGNPLVHLGTDGAELARSYLPAPFTHAGWCIRGVVRGDWILCSASGTDLALVERDSLTLLAQLADGRKYRALQVDRAGHLWVYVDGMAEVYDRQLNRLGRRRLKGKPVGSHLDGEGNLCVVTCQPKEALVRVYRLTE